MLWAKNYDNWRFRPSSGYAFWPTSQIFSYSGDRPWDHVEPHKLSFGQVWDIFDIFGPKRGAAAPLAPVGTRVHDSLRSSVTGPNFLVNC